MSLIDAAFEERLNRFLVRANRGGQATLCHLPNPGRLRELLQPGASVLLHRRPRLHRKTGYDLVAVRKGEMWVSIDTGLPNRAVRGWLAAETLPEFRGYSHISSEAILGESRLDFLLQNGRDCYLEVKSCTLVEDGDARFPDAPTTRGTRHMKTLTEAAGKGVRACVLFVVQRPDAKRFRPRDETDPDFGKALRAAYAKGVEIIAYRTTFDGVTLVDPQRIQTDLRTR
ncbi:MAG: DNA/RNA nuclease SfsA [Candidatus Thermoplasmatota archaeon]|nr:DNA/RNA nuclease SfsA [Candidatus Thermoplasmatota archaeon]